jgi:hypothetical protein
LADIYRQQIGAFRRFQDLTQELVSPENPYPI